MIEGVTPAFLNSMSGSTWVQLNYAVSATPEQCRETIGTYGNILMWKLKALEPLAVECGLLVLQDGHSKSSVIVACLQLRGDPNSAFTWADDAGKSVPKRARARTLCEILEKVHLIEQYGRSKMGRATTVSIVIGDFNINGGDMELSNTSFFFFLPS